ncbi:MAG: hypothetical protein CL949_06090 [Erythrobacter sp.]|nr:hypothetical protein [Erythrobacter sp.]
MMQSMEQRGSADEHLDMAVAAGHIGIWELDTVTGKAWRNLTHDRIFGYETLRDSWTFDDFLDHIVEEDRDEVEATYSAALADGVDWAFQCRIKRADGLVRWIDAHGRHLPGDDGKNDRLIGHVIDITETKRAEEHLRLVTAELNHRLKNIIASISGLVSLAARQEGDRKEISETLTARLAAIGRSHDLAYRERNTAVAVEHILQTELDAAPKLASQFRFEIDPKLYVTASLAERLTLVLHELMTNAIKYGALSTSEGRVSLKTHSNEDGDIVLRWAESNGPEVSQPSGDGFGSKLIRSSLSADAKVQQSFPPEGAICTITFPASTFVDKD